MSSSLDEAPVSSRAVLIKLIRETQVPEPVLSRLSIVTTVISDDGREARARTVVERPKTLRLDVQQQWDREVQSALRCMKGYSGFTTLTMGREYTIEWDGVCRPI